MSWYADWPPPEELIITYLLEERNEWGRAVKHSPASCLLQNHTLVILCHNLHKLKSN